MEFLDQLGKRVSQGLDRAKFEAEKFQRTATIQGELSHIQRELDSKMIELGQRAYDLHRAGHISSPSIAELATAIESLRANLLQKEEEMKAAKATVYVEPEEPETPPEEQTPPPAPGDHQQPTVPSASAASPPTSPPPTSPPPASSSPPQAGGPTIRIDHIEPPAAPDAKKECPKCSFQMPVRAVFCPNCGNRVEET